MDTPIASYSGTLAAGAQVNTNITLTANNTYIIKLNSSISTGAIKLNITGIVNHYTRLFSGGKIVCFRPTTTETLLISSVAAYVGGTNFSGPVDLSVYNFSEELANKLNMPTEYTVDLDFNGDTHYKSFTQCIMDLLDDERQKTIYLHGGDYNIFQEYHDFGMPVYTGNNWTEDYPDYCAHIPTNAHIVGQGIVKIIWMPDPATTSITLKESWTVAPINVFGSCILENFEIYCKNGRYCIHDDPLGDIRYTGATKIYKGLKCYRYTNDTEPGSGEEYGFNYTIGFGMDSSMHFEFIDCLLQNYETNVGSFYMHDRCLLNHKQQLVPTNETSDILVKNCIILTNNNSATADGMYAVELYNERPMYNTETGEIVDVKWTGEAYNNKDMPIRHCRVYFESTFIDGKVALFGTKGGGVNTCYNGYDLTFVNCNNVEVYYDDQQHNQYPPKFYNTDEHVIKIDGDQTTVNRVIAPNTKYVYDKIDDLTLSFAPGVAGAKSSISFETGFVPTILNITGTNVSTNTVFSNIDPYSNCKLLASWVDNAWALELKQERKNILPTDYQEVEYIEGVASDSSEAHNSCSFIDLGFQPVDNYEIYSRYTLADNIGGGGFVFGCYEQNTEEVASNVATLYVSKRSLENGKENFVTSWYAGSNGFQVANGYCHEYHTEKYMNIHILPTSRIYVGDSYNLYNNFKNANVNQTKAVPVTFVLNGTKDNITGVNDGGKFRFLRFNYKDTNRELYLVPCVNKCTKKVGMYDVLNNVFYTTDTGIKEFKAGPAINITEYNINFNTAYDHVYNKAATMADINDVVGDINAVLDRINGEVI